MTIMHFGGELELDDANIPVNIFITKLSESEIEMLGKEDSYFEEEGEEKPIHTWAKWRLTFDNFMPRRGLSTDENPYYLASTKAELLEVVETKILPMYERAYNALEMMVEGKRDTFYYWTEEDNDVEQCESVVAKESIPAITNRERAILRAFTRNSYELTEAEVDRMIGEELDGIDVDAMHEERLKRDRGEDEEEEPDDEHGLADLHDEGDPTPDDPEP